MRKLMAAAVLAATSFLTACVFESKAPLVPEADYATPLAPGAYALLERKEGGLFKKDSDAVISVTNGRYFMTTPDGPMAFVLYRVSPMIFLVQATDKPDENVYLILEKTADGAQITHLACAQLNDEERARFHLAPGPESDCAFESLDDLVIAAMYLKGRGESPSLKLVKQ